MPPPEGAATPRIELAQGPTPLLRLERLSAELDVELWIKRDDLTGLLESGNKVRKLEFLVGEALAAGADTLVTCGTLQSNCCRAVAAVARRLGLRAVLAYPGAAPEEPDGNYLLARLVGGEARFFPEDRWQDHAAMLEAIADDVRARGGRPFVIPESGATPAGALGYVACAEELAGQIRHGAPDFDAIVVAAFTGGSLAGLEMGRQLFGLRAEMVGVPVARSAESVREHVVATIVGARERFRLRAAVPTALRLLDGYQGVGRGEIAPRELETIVSVARAEGIALDPVYTAKAFGGMLDRLRREPGSLGRRVCFVHTGGVFSLFPHRRALGRLLGGGSGEGGS